MKSLRSVNTSTVCMKIQILDKQCVEVWDTGSEVSIVSAKLCNIISKEAFETIMTLLANYCRSNRKTKQKHKEKNVTSCGRIICRFINRVRYVEIVSNNFELQYNKIEFIKDNVTYTSNLINPSLAD